MKQKLNVQNFTEASREPKRRRSGATRAPHNRAARPGPWPCPLRVRAPWQPPDDALRLYKASGRKTLKESAFFPEQFRSSATVEDKFQGTEFSVPAPCWDGEVPPEPSPSVSIAVSAISIDLTAISINLAVSYDKEGVVLPRG
jgi:hypothetical protein